MLFFYFRFTMLLKKRGKEKKKMIHFGRKKHKKNQNYYHDNIYRWERDSFSSEVEIRWGIV